MVGVVNVIGVGGDTDCLMVAGADAEIGLGCCVLLQATNIISDDSSSGRDMNCRLVIMCPIVPN